MTGKRKAEAETGEEPEKKRLKQEREVAMLKPILQPAAKQEPAPENAMDTS